MMTNIMKAAPKVRETVKAKKIYIYVDGESRKKRINYLLYSLYGHFVMLYMLKRTVKDILSISMFVNRYNRYYEKFRSTNFPQKFAKLVYDKQNILY